MVDIDRRTLLEAIGAVGVAGAAGVTGYAAGVDQDYSQTDTCNEANNHRHGNDLSGPTWSDADLVTNVDTTVDIDEENDTYTADIELNPPQLSFYANCKEELFAGIYSRENGESQGSSHVEFTQDEFARQYVSEVMNVCNTVYDLLDWNARDMPDGVFEEYGINEGEQYEVKLVAGLPDAAEQYTVTVDGQDGGHATYTVPGDILGDECRGDWMSVMKNPADVSCGTLEHPSEDDDNPYPSLS